MCHSNSRIIDSHQNGIHKNLQKIVEKHQTTHFSKPIAAHTLAAFNAVSLSLSCEPCKSLILDSGCGTAMSTRLLAEQYSDAWVIGVDRSIKRLSKQYETPLPSNAWLVQADLIDFWRLALQAGWQLKRHMLLYPNPYPKSVHLKRRFHAHPVFRDLLALGGIIELRTNWGVYAEEFCFSANLMGKECQRIEVIQDTTPLTLFEKKYQESKQRLYRVIVE
jgi:tRNA (guanine-N7-)-methyltransferase